MISSTLLRQAAIDAGEAAPALQDDAPRDKKPLQRKSRRLASRRDGQADPAALHAGGGEELDGKNSIQQAKTEQDAPADVIRSADGRGSFDGGAGLAGLTNSSQETLKATDGSDIIISSFDELVLDLDLIKAIRDAWEQFINIAASHEAAGEVIYAAFFEAAPGLQSLFTTPRAVQAMRFYNSLSFFVTSLDDPGKLRMLVETIGFAHMHFDVTLPRVVLFRDALLDLLSLELGEGFVAAARDGWTALLNYVGGAIIYVKANYAERIQTLLQSWKAVNDKSSTAGQFEQLASAEMGNMADEADEAESQQTRSWKVWQRSRRRVESNTEGVSDKKGSVSISANQTPTTYDEMFRFNAAVMGAGGNPWLDEVLACFNNIVTNVSNAHRLTEECDILVLRISKVAKGTINFSEYKSCMLASLRSLLPKEWSTKHEVAWSWLWENVESLLVKNLGNTRKWERALAKFYGSLDPNSAFEIRKNIYARFFAAAPAGQDFFKQSNTYLHFIAERNMAMTLELFRDPVKLVDDISAIGLRHVGYGIPTELFGPFVSCFVEAVMAACTDPEAVESFRWSLGLIAKITVRTISEGSTIVMKAVNQNSSKQLRKALACAPRSERSSWMLLVQVGTQDISPLAWAIESGAHAAAATMLTDLLTIRADRDRYYYSMDTLFKRHPDIIKCLVNDAPLLLPKLLDGLIWRSRMIEDGQRRVNYYVKHLIVSQDSSFSRNLEWLALTQDPKLVCHPTILFSSYTVWSNVACQSFMYGKSWLLLTLVIFITGQSVFKHLNEGENSEIERILVFSFRAFVYTFSMTQLMYTHLKKWVMAFASNDKKELRLAFGVIPFPRYLEKWQELVAFSLVISLLMMLALEPILYCLNFEKGAKLFWEDCPEADHLQYYYSIFSMLAMFLYYGLLIDLAVLSTKVSAYVLVCSRMVSEVGLFILALSIMLLTFSSAISIVNKDQPDFAGIHKGLLTLAQVTAAMFDGHLYERYEQDPVVLGCVFLFLVGVSIFLMNLLVAQLTCAYESVYEDMVGYARLERLQIIVSTMQTVRERRWLRFLQSMRFDRKVEFNAGDVGVAGGMQTSELASINPTTVDMIRRYGGSTSAEVPWPEDEDGGDIDDCDQFDKLEKVISKALKKAAGTGGGRKNTGSMGSNIGSGATTSTASKTSQDERRARENSIHSSEQDKA